jgi:hypothetical protein
MQLGTCTGGPAAKAGRVVEGAAPPTGLADLSPELVEELVKLVDRENPCYEVVKLCEVKREWWSWCRSGALYDAANRALGYYGKFKTWAEVLAHYAAVGQVPPGGVGGAPTTPRNYFQSACQTVIDPELANVPRYHPFYEARLLMQMRATGLFSLQNVPVDLSNYGDLALVALGWDGDALRYVPTSRADYGALARVALERVGAALQHVPTERPDYDELAKIALVQDGMALRHVPERKRLAFTLIAVKQNGMALQHYSVFFDNGTHFAEYFEICKAAVRQNGMALPYVASIGSELFNFDEVARIAVTQSPYAFQYIGNWTSVNNYGELAHLAVRRQWMALARVDLLWPGYGAIARETLQTEGRALQCVPVTRDDFGELAQIAVLQTDDALEYVPGDRDDYFEIARMAVQRMGDALRLVDPSNDNYVALAKIAMQSKGKALEHVPEDHGDFSELAKIALLQDASALGEVPHASDDYVALAKVAVQRSGSALFFVPHDAEFMSVEDYYAICRIAVQQDGDAIEHASLAFRDRFGHSQLRYAEWASVAKAAMRKDAGSFRSMVLHAWQGIDSLIDGIGLEVYFDLATVAVRADSQMIELVPAEHREAVRERVRSAILASR